MPEEVPSLEIRDEPPLPDEAVVVRAGVMARASVQAAAEVNYVDFGFYGVSVFSIVGKGASEIWTSTEKLAPPRYKKVRTSTAKAIREAGFQLLPTWEETHFDIVLDDPPDESTWDALDRIFGPATESPR